MQLKIHYDNNWVGSYQGENEHVLNVSCVKFPAISRLLIKEQNEMLKIACVDSNFHPNLYPHS